MQTESPQKLLRFPAVEARVAYKRSRIYSLIKEGKFPAPKRLPGGRASAWLESEVDAWIASVAEGGAQ